MHELPAFTVARTYPMGFHVANDALNRLMVIPGSAILGAPLNPQLMQLPFNSHLVSLLGLQSRFQLLHTEVMPSVAKLAARQWIRTELPGIGPDLA